MKKLLSILGVLGITASGSSIVVACGTNDSIHRFSTPTLMEELRDQLIMKLMNDEDGDLSSIINGKWFNEIITKDTNVVLKMLEDKVGKLANKHFKDIINDNLQLSERGDFYENQIDEIASDILQNQFYLQYTKNLINKNPISLDEEINFEDLSSLNPQNLLINKTTGDDSNQYFVYFQKTGDPVNTWTRWQYATENSDTNFKNSIPSIEELQSTNFIILRDSSKETATLPDTKEVDITNKDNLCYLENGIPQVGDNRIVYSKDGENAFEMNGKTALEYRFQEYFTTQQEKIIAKSKDTEASTNFYELLLTMSYLDSNFYNISANSDTQSRQDAFLNLSSNLAQTTQTWSKTDGYQSKLKMVWSFTFRDSTAVDKAWELLQGRKCLGPGGALLDSSQQTLIDLYHRLEEEDGIGTNHSESGSDPFFNLNGYSGLVKNDDTNENITSVDGNLEISDAAKAKIAKITRPTILTADGNGTAFTSGTRQNEYDYIFVLPIYLVDLLNDRTGGFDQGQSTTAFVKYADLNQGKANLLYSSYGKAIIDQGKALDESKTTEINNHLSQTNNFYIYVDGVPYTIDDFNRSFLPKIPPEGTIPPEKTIWDYWPASEDVTDTNGVPKKISGLQFSIQNTFAEENIIGNIGVNQDVRLGNYSAPTTPPPTGITFSSKNGELYVNADENWVGKFYDFGDFKLSFDDASKDGLITIQGNTSEKDTQNQGKTYSYKVNLGPNASDREGYLTDANGFDYDNLNISSQDISNLSTEKKNSLLREIEFVTSRETGVSDTAVGSIFPLFLEKNQILFQPLYNSLKKYLIDEDGGTSD